MEGLLNISSVVINFGIVIKAWVIATHDPWHLENKYNLISFGAQFSDSFKEAKIDSILKIKKQIIGYANWSDFSHHLRRSLEKYLHGFDICSTVCSFCAGFSVKAVYVYQLVLGENFIHGISAIVIAPRIVAIEITVLFDDCMCFI